MKKLAALSLATALALGAHGALASDEPDMIGTMGDMQLFLHKLSLSVDAGNTKLADFYAHELEEAIEAAEGIEKYHDIPVGQLTGAMLVPSFEALEKALDGEDAGQVRSRLGEVIEACNACHQATGYGFIDIQPTEANPYMQSFAPKDD